MQTILVFGLLAVIAQDGSATDRSPRAVIAGYLEQLEKLDQDGMNRFLAEKVTSRSLDGSEDILDRDAMRQMRDFQRAVKTTWTHRIVYASFKRWLSTMPAAASDTRLTRDGAATLIFDRESAAAMRPWLQRWAAEKRGRSEEKG